MYDLYVSDLRIHILAENSWKAFTFTKEVSQLERFDEVRVPNETAVRGTNVSKLIDHSIVLIAALREYGPGTVHRRMQLHNLLHLSAQLRGFHRAVSEAQSV